MGDVKVLVRRSEESPFSDFVDADRVKEMKFSGEIEERPIRDWVKDENGVARNTIVGTELVRKK
jgi:hypothetical protein